MIMTVADLLERLEMVRSRGHGRWSARCPAHSPDRNPSLSIREGERGLLVKCWTGCTIEEITAALGLSVADIFYDSDLPRCERLRAKLTPKPKPLDWRRFAGELQDEAVDHWLRGTVVLEAARGLNITEWTDADIEEALEAITCARADLARADCLDRLAFNIRAGGLREELDHGTQSQRSAA